MVDSDDGSVRKRYEERRPELPPGGCDALADQAGAANVLLVVGDVELHRVLTGDDVQR